MEHEKILNETGHPKRIVDLAKEIKELRKLLWLNHGCIGLYGDDGEMQCSRCMIDFKRDGIDKIDRLINKT